jgi:serine protease Do
VLSIDPGKQALIAAKFAASSTPKVGQLVFTCGYPELLTVSGGLSSGFISAVNRVVLLEDGTSLQMIQTDARFAQSSSGGPLVNFDGQVIGLLNSNLNRNAYDSMNYALPAGIVKQVVENLVNQGYVTGRVWLGVTVLSEENFLELQKLYRFPDGLYVSNVIKDSPAYISGLRKGDIITLINDEVVHTHLNIAAFLLSKKAGDLVEIKVYRKTDGLYHDLTVYLQEYIR